VEVEVTTSLIAASGAILVAGASYWFTKQQERSAELRREKLAHYKDFAAALSGIISGEGTPDGQRVFSRACNALNLVAPQAVLEALQRFQQGIKTGNSSTREEHDKLMSALFMEIRKDLGVSPDDDPNTFRVGLWASGVAAHGPNKSLERTREG
jgi:hypothetical protein